MVSIIFRCNFGILLIIILFFILESPAQDRRIVLSDRANQYFQAGIAAFNEQDYESAQQQFELILDMGDVTQRTTAAYVMSAKSLIELGQNRDAARLLQRFLDRFPRSSYQDDAYFTLGVAYMRDRRYEDALHTFMRAINVTDDPELQGNSEAYLSRIISEHLTLDNLQNIYDDTRAEFERGFLALALSQRYIEHGNFGRAQSLLEDAVNRYSRHPLINDLQALLDNLEEGITLKVGVILPLFEGDASDPIANLGREVLQGIQLAVEQHNAESDIQLFLDIRDTRREPSIAARHVQELVNDNEVVMILGPIFSDEAFATAGVANARGVPIITPTATANHIADIGRYVFQTNPDHHTRGRAMARYAVEHLGYSTLAVLAPIDSHGRDIAEGFREEINELPGAYIAVNEWYRSGETTLTQQFYNIRKYGLQDSLHMFVSFSGEISQDDIFKIASTGVELELLDSLIENESAIPVNELLGEDGPRIADSLGLNVITGDLYADSLDIPVESLDAIFLPITSKEEMGIVSAQIAYHNIRTQLLGSGEWHDILALEENRRYVNGVYFLSDSFWNTEDSTFIEFFDSFRDATGNRPTRNTLMGYDTMKLLSLVINEGATTRDGIAGILSSGIFYRGIHSPIVMGRNRVNAAKNVLRYMAGEIFKVDEIILN